MYITLSELLSFVIMLIALLTYIDNRNHKQKK